ncbi:MAG: hypothetical protein KA765_07390 [Thermoflexales bacterium]|nr:hypothetical protein [Thermoflexales bacterium]
MLSMSEAIPERIADVWTERLQALDSLMYAMSRDYDTLSLARWDTLKPLIRCLQAYGRDLLTYFHAGFITRRLEVSDDYSPEAVYSIVLNQIGYDLEVLQRAVQQRASGSAAMTETLKETDKLAWLALKPAIDAGLLPADTTAVTYFQKSPVSRVIPYAPVALIGVPYSCMSVARDHLALPHEIGHYVFWHGQVPGTGQPLRQALQRAAFEELKQCVTLDSPEFPTWCAVWLEELFADAYGALIAGPVMALDFQDLALHSSCADFTTSDNDHPVPILRPEIYSRVLSRAANDTQRWADWAAALRQRWLARRARCGGSTTFTVNGRSIPLRHALSANGDQSQPVDRLLNVITTRLAGIQSDWCGDLSGPVQLDRLFEQQRAYLPTLLATATADLDPGPVTATHWLKQAQNAIKLNSQEFVTIDVWRKHLAAEGWTSEGPDNRWP